MRAICEICKIPFKEDDLINLRVDQYKGLANESDVPDDLKLVQICESCYKKYSVLD